LPLAYLLIAVLKRSTWPGFDCY